MTRIAAVHFSYYPQDPRPRREAEALVEAGMSVDIICLRDPAEVPEETVHGVRVHRIPLKRTRAGKLTYIAQYLHFIFFVFLKLSVLHLKNRYDLVHIHNMPDFLVACAVVPKLSGAKVLLDLHDPMPELYQTKYPIGDGSAMMKVLKILERWSIRFADQVITPNKAFRELFISRGCPPEKIQIVMNSPMESVFEAEPEPAVQEHDTFVVMFHGSIFQRHGLDTALEAIATLRQKEIPNIRFKVFGSGDYEADFKALAARLALNDVVDYFGPVPLEVISREIRSIDVGIVPNRRNPFTEINFPVRIFEYLCLRKPVIVPRTTGILDYFDDSSIFFFEPGNAESLASVISAIHRDRARRNAVIDRGVKVYTKYRWQLQRKILLNRVVCNMVDCSSGPREAWHFRGRHAAGHR